MKKRIAVTCILALFIFAALMCFTTVVHFSTYNNLVHAQGPWTLTVYTAYDSPTPGNGSCSDDITALVTSPTPGGPGIQYICTGRSGNGNVPASGTASSVTFTITQDSTITWNWKTQYLLTKGGRS